MKETNKIPYIPIIGGLLILLIGYFIVGVIGGLVGGVVVGAILYAVMSKNKTDGKTGPAKDSEASKPTNENTLETSLESLVKANLTLRKNIVLPKVRDAFESVIDTLLDVLPKVHDAIPDGELYWVVNRIATEYLPNKSINPYLGLTSEDQQLDENVTKVMDSVKSIMAELSEVSQLLTTKNLNEFNIKAKFLQHRFNV
ncbi:MAG: hypothetical protein ACI9WC_002280 [Arenicella sp.]|jgi:hypothetical protein